LPLTICHLTDHAHCGQTAIDRVKTGKAALIGHSPRRHTTPNNSALYATVIVFRGRRSSVVALMASGVFLAGFVAVEALILKQVPHSPTLPEIFYFGVGAAIIGFAIYFRRARRQPA
jgi:ABC-type transport system involved in cytochrome c biogenesis permease subunit